MSVRVLQGDCREVLKTLPDESVHCVVTSPPYWSLRDYGVDGQLGLESSPQAFVDAMRGVFAEVRRVLRDDGTLWLNLGSSYAASGMGGNPAESEFRKQATNAGSLIPGRSPPVGFKPKDMVPIPWMVAMALQADGWYLRQDIIWAKPNPMPESVRDRCTKAHEYLFLLAKSERYYFDASGIAEPCVVGDNGSSYTDPRDEATKPNLGKGPRKQRKPAGWDTGTGAHGTIHRDGRAQEIEYTETDGTTRNKRSVWTVTTHPFSEAHFATFPPALIEPCILAGCPEGGVVLDPFFGAGTTGLVADRIKRDCIGIELNPTYAKLAANRIRNDAPLFSSVSIVLPRSRDAERA